MILDKSNGQDKAVSDIYEYESLNNFKVEISSPHKSPI